MLLQSLSEVQSNVQRSSMKERLVCQQRDPHSSTRTHTRAHMHTRASHTQRKRAREPARAQHFTRNTSDLQLTCWLFQPCPPRSQERCCSFPCTQPSSRKAGKITKSLSCISLTLGASSPRGSVQPEHSALQIVLCLAQLQNTQEHNWDPTTQRVKQATAAQPAVRRVV